MSAARLPAAPELAPLDTAYPVPPLSDGRPPCVALVGCGKAAAMHARTLRRLEPAIELVFASRDGARAQAYAARLRGARAVAGYEAAVADPAVDIVLVTTPPPSHAPWARAALAHGKHAIVEKPPFVSVAEFDEVLAAARRAERRLLVAENYAYKPLVPVLRRLLAPNGAVGELRAGFLNALKRQRTPADDWRADAAATGGGALFEGGIHWLSLLANIGLSPTRVTGHSPDGATPDRTMTVTIEYAEGGVVTLLYGWETPALVPGVRWSRLYGTAGAIGFESNGLVVATSGRRRGLRFPGVRDLAGYRAMFADYLSALRTGREPQLTTGRARRDLLMVEAALHSAGLR